MYLAKVLPNLPASMLTKISPSAFINEIDLYCKQLVKLSFLAIASFYFVPREEASYLNDHKLIYRCNSMLLWFFLFVLLFFLIVL